MGGYIFWIVNCNFLGFLGGVFVYIYVGRVWEVVIVGFDFVLYVINVDICILFINFWLDFIINVIIDEKCIYI